MGTAKLQAFMPIQTGPYFFESFESTNWLTDGLWTTLHGTPTRSSLHSHDGIWSLEPNGTWPLISKTLPAGFQGQVWFYDDATNTTGTASYVKIAVGSHICQIGVNNAVSTTNYVAQSDGSGSDSATSFPRSTGWHAVLILNNGTRSSLSMYDGTYGATCNLLGTNLADTLILGSPATVGNTPVLYFDDIIVVKNLSTLSDLLVRFALPVSPTGWTAKLFDENGSFYSPGYTGQASLVSGNFLAVSFFVVIEDVQLSAKLFDATGRLRYVLPLTSITSGDVYKIVDVDFGRRGAPDQKPQVSKSSKSSNSGKTETLFFSGWEQGSLTVPQITDAIRSQLKQWWSVAGLGLPYSVVLNSDDQFSAIVNTATVYGQPVYVDDARGAAIGEKLILASDDHAQIEELTVSAVDTTLNKITFSDGPNYSYAVGATLRDRYFYPQVLSIDNQLPCSLADQKANRWTFNHQFKELL